MFLSFPLLLTSSGFFSKILSWSDSLPGGFAELNVSSLLRLSVIVCWKGARGDPGRWGSNPTAKGSSICAPAVRTTTPEHSILARGSLSCSSQSQIPLPLALGACMASFQLQTQHHPAVISGTARLSHSMSACWHPRHWNGWWEEVEQGEGHLFQSDNRSPQKAGLAVSASSALILFILQTGYLLPPMYVPQRLFLPSDEYRQLGTLTKDLPSPMSWFKLLKRATAFHRTYLPILSNLHWAWRGEIDREAEEWFYGELCRENCSTQQAESFCSPHPTFLQVFPLLHFRLCITTACSNC